MLLVLFRIGIGALFIFSGLIKANDALGFSYKLDEYFDVFGMHWLSPFALAIAIFMCALETLLGVMLLLGARIKLTLWLLLLMLLFFAFLNFYSGYYNKVTECGCFGDFIIMTPWQEFRNNVIMLVMTIILLIRHKDIQPLMVPYSRIENGVVLFFAVLCLAFPLYTYNYLPVIDFRAYKVGTDLYKAIHPQVKYQYKLKNKKTGEVKVFDAWPPDWDKEWDFIEAITTPLDKDVTPIIGFAMHNQYGEDYTDEFLQKQGYKFLLVEYDLDKANKGVQGKINDFATVCATNNIEFAALTSSDSTTLLNFQKEYKVNYQFYMNLDDVPLRTMIRSNPGLVLLKDATVVAMWHYHSFPSFADVKEKYFK